MGKASKWLKNLWTGKKDNQREKNASFSSEKRLVVFPSANLPDILNDKRRWSFGRSSPSSEERADISKHKSTRSLDAIATAQLVSQALLGYDEPPCAVVLLPPPVAAAKPDMAAVTCQHENEHNKESVMASPVLPNEATQILVAAPRAVARQVRPLEDAAAAIKIQATFRSYLARRALNALRGLVKIQAFVRGNLVRKQTSEMLRCMNALMSIQVRARVQRIQMSEEPPVDVKGRITHREPSAQEKLQQLSRGYKDTEQEHQYLRYPNSPPLTDRSSSNHQSEDFSYNRISRENFTVSKFKHTKAPPSIDYSDSTSQDSHSGPNYMANTESSRAKVRSQSEPKQRPVKQKTTTRQSPSIGGINITTPDNQRRYPYSNMKKNQQPWLIRIYRAAKSSKDIQCDSTSIRSNSSSYCQTLTAYEPAVNLY